MTVLRNGWWRGIVDKKKPIHSPKIKRRGNQLTNSFKLFWKLEARDHVNGNQMIVYNPNISLFKVKKNPFIINSDKNQFNNPNG